jgi:diaminohydroxyphosphoribosylaminopyrimidine deaminase/5-amino-6-(5-phosphoribosylamino)uracil reductase
LQIKDLPIRRVVYGLVDPFHLVAGKGAQIIKDSGKEAILFSDLVDPSSGLAMAEVAATEAKFLQSQLEILAENFLKNIRYGKSFVALKWAQSLDGKMALKNYESQWITNSISRNYAHYLRSIYDVTIVGSGTVLKDNPKLNIRLDGFSKENKLLIIDPNAAVYQAYERLEIANHHKKENVYFVVDTNSSNAAVAFNLAVDPPGSFNNVLFLKRDADGFFSLSAIQEYCFERKMKSILIEGGPKTLGQYIKQNAFDRIYAFIAPVLLGNGLGYSEELSVPTMADKLQLLHVEKTELGDDILLTGLRK